MSFKIIDAHMHLGPSTGRMVPDYSIESLVALMDHLDIEKGISANCLSLDSQPEAGIQDDFIAHEKSGGRLFSFFGYDPLHIEKSIDVIDRYHDDPRCVGIKIHPSGSKVHADDERYRPVWEAAKKYNLPLMSHTWALSSYNPNQTYAVAELFEKYIREYPEVTFVFGHCGGRYEGIKTAIEIGKKYPNANYDITGDIWLNGFIEELVAGVGADRIVYGSDFTMIEQRPMMGVVLGSELPAIDKEKILRYTAARIYFGEE